MSILAVAKTCKAGVDGGTARCRNMAMEGSDFCSLPAHKDGKGAVAPTPDVVLTWFKLSEGWAARFRIFLNTKIRSPRRQRELDKKHVAQAKGIRRSPQLGGIRKGIVDSGSPVFGPAGVTGHRVWAANVIEDLFTAGYFIGNALVTEKQILGRKPEYRLLVEWRLEGEGFAETPSEFLGDLFIEFGDAIFEKVLVWANPPNEKGVVVHTVNFGGRQSGKATDCALRFDGVNDWLLAAIPPEVPAAPVLA